MVARVGGVQVGPGSQASGLRPHRAAAEIIEWTDLGCSIFADKREIEEYRARTGVRVRRPLKPKSLERIAEGVLRHVLKEIEPFVLGVTQTGDSGGWKVSAIDQPLPTQTTRQDLAMCSPVVTVGRDGANSRSVRDPLPTITAGNGPGRGAGAGHALGMCTPIIAAQNTGVFGGSPDAPVGTITTLGHQALIAPILSPCGGPKRQPESVGGTMNTVLTREDRGLAIPLLATTGYGERPGQAARVNSVRDPLGTVVNGSKQAVVTPIVVHNTAGHTGGAAHEPLPTITTGGQSAVAAPLLAYANHGEKQTSAPDEPLRTVVSGGHHAGLVAPLMAEYHGSGSGETLQRPDQPLGCVSTVEGRGLVAVRLDLAHPRIRKRALQTARFLRKHLGADVQLNADGFAFTIIDGCEMVIVDILFRMLRVLELAAAMGFGAERIWPTSSRDATRLIGNAVAPPMAAALVGSLLPRGRPTLREVAA